MNLYGLGCRSSTLSGVELHDGHTAGLFLYRVSLVQQKVKRCCSVSSASVFVTFAAHRKTGKACGKNEMSAVLFLSGRVFQSIKTLFLCFASTEHQSRALPDTQLSYVAKVQFPGGTFHTLPRQQMWHYCELHVTYHWLPVKATVSQAAGEPHGHARLQYRGNYWIKTVHGNKLAK